MRPPLSGTASPPSSMLFLCGGGTGGHVYPALAVASQLANLARAGGVEPHLLYIGSHDGMEQGLVKRESNLPFRGIPAAAIRGRGPLAVARNLLTLAQGTLAAQALIRALQPAAILGTGGYVCVPLFLAARLARVPSVIYLPDIVPGLAVKLLARLANVVACTAEESRRFFPRKRVVVTGYPARSELFTTDAATARAAFGLSDALPVVLVYGGSRGARSINQAIKALLPYILQRAQVIHVCGREGDQSWLHEAALSLDTTLRTRYHLFPYLHSDQPPSMLQAFAAADLAVCRSGASTLAELPASRLPAILIPYPFVHQEENADYLVAHGAAHKIHDDALSDTSRAEDGQLWQLLLRLLESPAEREQLRQQAAALARPDAAARLAQLLLELAGRSKTG